MNLPRKKGEVMWPRLVASKILKKRLGSNNFVADYPSDDADCLLNLPHQVDQKSLSSNSIFNDYDNQDTQKYKVFVSTWNVGGVTPNEDMNMDDFLDTCNTPCDIYVFGFQEVVPLNPSNVLGSESNKITTKWNSLIRETLNKKSTVLFNEKNKIIQRNDAHDDDQKLKMISGSSTSCSFHDHQQEFRCIISKQMVGILISVWIRSDLHSYVRNPSVSCVGCGIMGCLGNKGSVAVRFRLHETSFCFVCSHLASGGKEGDEKHRNTDAADIMSRTTFPKGPSHDLPRKILDHDRIVFLGDLNYRISLQESDTRLLVDRREWNTLLKNDQLRMELMDGQVFEGWHEGRIEFAPTYKYYPNSDTYYGCLNTKKGEKKRSPAWCDRIIWSGKGLNQHLYTRGELKLSDHRPVKAIFSAQVKFSRKLKTFQSFFLSERFEKITNRLEMMHSDDNYLSNARASFHVTNTLGIPQENSEYS